MLSQCIASVLLNNSCIALAVTRLNTQVWDRVARQRSKSVVIQVASYKHVDNVLQLTLTFSARLSNYCSAMPLSCLTQKIGSTIGYFNANVCSNAIHTLDFLTHFGKQIPSWEIEVSVFTNLCVLHDLTVKFIYFQAKIPSFSNTVVGGDSPLESY